MSVTRGVRAAIRVAKGLDRLVDKPLLIQETNSTVVWLRPHSIIAKVGTHAESAEFLTREHEVASILTAAGSTDSSSVARYTSRPRSPDQFRRDLVVSIGPRSEC